MGPALVRPHDFPLNLRYEQPRLLPQFRHL